LSWELDDILHTMVVENQTLLLEKIEGNTQ
jgi:hypothetical protein